MNLSLPVNQTRQCPLVISKVTKWKWKMCLLRHCFDFERVRHATWLHSFDPTLPQIFAHFPLSPPQQKWAEMATSLDQPGCVTRTLSKSKQ